MDGSDIVVLSDDSDIDDMRDGKVLQSDKEDLDLSDFDAQFPKVNLNGFTKTNTNENGTEKEIWDNNNFFSESHLDSPDHLEYENYYDYLDTNCRSNLRRHEREEPKSDSDYESQNTPSIELCNELSITNNKKINIQKNSPKLSDEEKESEEINFGLTNKRRKTKKELNEEAKKKRQEEKEQNKVRKQDEAAKKKALKELNSKNRLFLKPEHSLKLMKIFFDQELERFEFFNDSIKIIKEHDLSYEIKSNLIPNSITWQRAVNDNYLNDKNEVCSNSMLIDENQTILIWNYEQAVLHMAENTFVAAIENIKSLIPDQKLTLVIYKIGNYFKQQKNATSRSEESDDSGTSRRRKKNKIDKTFVNIPKVSRIKFQEYLTEIEVLHNVSFRPIESEGEIALLIRQYTKALAFLPLKLEKNKQPNKFDWYIDCDNRDTVKVDKSGNGLRRLWQQQLCQFTLMRLEAAEAIASVYKSPVQLMNAYDKCSPAEGEKLLKDLPIRRAAGPVTTVRKIGPELSRKIYLMFTSKNGDIHLNDQEN